MGTIFVHEFAALPHRADELEDVLRRLLGVLEQADGYRSGQLLQSRDDPSRFILMAVWEGPEAHGRAVENMPVELMQRAMTLVAEVPRGGAWTDRSSAPVG